MKKLIALCVEGAKIIDLCIQGDKFIEEGTGGVYNKPVKGVKTSKGASYITCGFESMYTTFEKASHSQHPFL
jgi:hypothetical protein